MELYNGNRLSFSIPDDVDIMDDIISTSLLENDHTPVQIATNCSDNDTMQNNMLYTQLINSNTFNKIKMPTEYHYISYLSQNILLTTSSQDTKLYKIPPKYSIDARYVWKSAKLFKYAYIRDIEILLLEWASKNASLSIVGDKIDEITWKSNTNCWNKSTWNTFLHWIICASLSQTT